ncbi:MAG TPA: tRNA (guanosine(46)-N7)-methyltransferase TrmB [Gemmatimonadota bacterium]|nr:tRNA (guanosine(46)-N7)-methyltransferase TrmB [Gemmatimonadota bacterium]
MPHVVLQTHSPLHEIVDRLEPFVVKDSGTVWRLRETFIDRRGAHALCECLTVRAGRIERFLVQLSQREEDGAVVVRPYAVPRVEPVPSVKRMVALVAEAAVRAHPDVAVERSTIGDFLSDRWTFTPDPDPAGWDPLLPERGLPRPLDWAGIFGDDRPVEIEIGSGKGSFLVESAEADPATGWVSVEWARAYAGYVRDRVRRRNLTNVRVVRGDAGAFLEGHVAPGSVRRIHLYFPDPWPTERHHKRRLVQPAFVAAVADALEPGGEIRFVTDHAEYFAEAVERFEAEPRLERREFPEEETPLTNYLVKYREEGRPFHRARFVRIDRDM